VFKIGSLSGLDWAELYVIYYALAPSPFGTSMPYGSCCCFWYFIFLRNEPVDEKRDFHDFTKAGRQPLALLNFKASF